jgi:uncharacterized protein (TIGR02145 family)
MPAPVPETKEFYGLTWVKLDNKWWSTTNYSDTKLADGTDIPEVTVNAEWAALSTPAWCWYNNTEDAAFRAKYGRLYNGFAVRSGLKTPSADSRVPSSAEYTSLINWLIAQEFNWDGTTATDKTGKSLASRDGEWTASGTAGHVGNDQGSNNSSNLNVLPGGQRTNSGAFSSVGVFGLHWTSTTSGAAHEATYFYNAAENVGLAYGRPSSLYGFSVRLVCDSAPAAVGGGVIGSSLSIGPNLFL